MLTRDDIDRHTDEAYDRWAEARPEKNLFLSESDRDTETAAERDRIAEEVPATEWK